MRAEADADRGVCSIEGHEVTPAICRHVSQAYRPDRGVYPFAQIDANSLSEASFVFPEAGFAFGFQTKDTPRSAVVDSQESMVTITSSTSAALSGCFSVETAGSFAKKKRPRAQGLVAFSVGFRSQQHVLTRVVAANRSLQRRVVVEFDAVRAALAALAAQELDLYVIDAIGVSIDDAQHRGMC